jgi:hypothetical protein
MKRRLVLATLSLLLFTQLIVVVQACDSLAATPVSAFVDDEPCHDDGLRNACLAHCQQDDRTSDHLQIFVSAPPSNFILVPLPQASTPASRYLVPARLSDPPLAIRFCSFQI